MSVLIIISQCVLSSVTKLGKELELIVLQLSTDYHSTEAYGEPRRSIVCLPFNDDDALSSLSVVCCEIRSI